MYRLQKRLAALEAKLTDRSRLIPHSPEWLAFWTEEIEAILNGKSPRTLASVPLDAICAWMLSCPDTP